MEVELDIKELTRKQNMNCIDDVRRPDKETIERLKPIYTKSWSVDSSRKAKIDRRENSAGNKYRRAKQLSNIITEPLSATMDCEIFRKWMWTTHHESILDEMKENQKERKRKGNQTEIVDR